MSRQQKIHLEMPPDGDYETLCSRKSVQETTRRPELVTCKQCKLTYNYCRNDDWWARAWSNYERKEEQRSVQDVVDKMAQNMADELGVPVYTHREYRLGIMTARDIRREHAFPDVCDNDGKPILVMAFLGEDYCSENCRKDLATKETA